MTTGWILNTRGDPPAALKAFLGALWERLPLAGMLLPVFQAESYRLAPALVEDPACLETIALFAPLAGRDLGKAALEIAAGHPSGRLGVILRPCESRVLARLARWNTLDRARWVTLEVDCLASFPAEEAEWRLRKAGSIEALAGEALRFAHLGGIAPYRYRRGCQMCASLAEWESDLRIGLYGLPVSERMLVMARDDETTGRLHLEAITDGPAPVSLLAQRQNILERLYRRRQGARRRATAGLPQHLPRELDGWIEHIRRCSPCQKCLQACPTYRGELAASGPADGPSRLAVAEWLAGCLVCGLCEEACPKGLPLTAVVSGLSEALQAGEPCSAAGPHARPNEISDRKALVD